MFRINLFFGALALIGATGVMACDCGTNGTTARVNDATTNVGTQRFPAADTSYSRNDELSGVKRATAEDQISAAQQKFSKRFKSQMDRIVKSV